MTNHTVNGLFLVIIIMFVGAAVYYNSSKSKSCPKCPTTVCKSCPDCPECPTCPSCPECPTTSDKGTTSVTHQVSSVPVDPVKEYDRSKVYDPLTSPTRRSPRDQIPPYYLKRRLDIHTRGYPDNYQQMGVLIRVSSSESTDNYNKILRLFGRQKYPSSNKYEYYATINSGNDMIKIQIDNKYNKELYDDDIVTISALGTDTYKVSLYDNDTWTYYPDIL